MFDRVGFSPQPVEQRGLTQGTEGKDGSSVDIHEVMGIPKLRAARRIAD